MQNCSLKTSNLYTQTTIFITSSNLSQANPPAKKNPKTTCIHTCKNVLYAHTCGRTHLPTCTLWGIAWVSVNIFSQQLGCSPLFVFCLFFCFLLQTGLTRCADRLQYLEELEECHNIYSHGCADHPHHPLPGCQG